MIDLYLEPPCDPPAVFLNCIYCNGDAIFNKKNDIECLDCKQIYEYEPPEPDYEAVSYFEQKEFEDWRHANGY